MAKPPLPPRPPAPTLHSIPLLDVLLRDALDPGYAEATARREAAEAAGAPSRRLASRTIGLVGLVALAILGAVAIGQQRASAPDAARARSRLATEVTQRTQLVDFLTKQVEALRAQTATARDAALAQSRAGAEVTDLVRSLEDETGASPMSGPGLNVRLADAAHPVAGGSTRDEGRIQDRDVQDVVNALWAAGARGVAVNGIRLTAQTAIRTAGEAILVDFRPQVSPYVVSAVGDSNGLQVSFAGSPVAQRFATWTQLYGLGFNVSRSSSIKLSAAAPTAPRHARALTPLPSASGAADTAPSPSASSSQP